MNVLVKPVDPEFGAALSAFKRVVNAPKVLVTEKVHSFPFAVGLATMLGVIK